jgi:hypothetical protein
MNNAEWSDFIERTGLSSCRRGMAEEILLFAYFDAKPVAGCTPGGVPAGEVYERLVEGEPLLFGRSTAAVIGYELLAASAPFDGGSPG